MKTFNVEITRGNQIFDVREGIEATHAEAAEEQIRALFSADLRELLVFRAVDMQRVNTAHLSPRPRGIKEKGGKR